MKRREALAALAGFAVVGGLAAHSSAEGGVAAVLFKRLGYLNLDRGDVMRFARDYGARGLMSAGKLRAVSAASALYGAVPQSWEDFVSRDIAHGEERIVTTFLLSSDFFRGAGKAAEPRTSPVRYVGFFDPLRGGNPFARLRVQGAPVARGAVS